MSEWNTRMSRHPMMLVIIVACMLSIGCASGGPGAASPHHAKGGFQNCPPTPAMQPGFLFKCRRVYGSFFLPDVPGDHLLSQAAAVDLYQKLQGKNSVTWLGHSTFLLRIGKTTILTDPFLTEYASPFFKGARRFVRPGLPIEALPAIDAIIISHDHYDHLDSRTLERLPRRETIRVFVPLGLKAFFLARGYRDVTELDWYETATFRDLQFDALPAIHGSGRTPWGRNSTLWCSWAIRHPSASLYFAGDTAYSPLLFRQIGMLYDGFDAALVPIGAYEPREKLRGYHCNPEEALAMGLDLHAELMVAMHWGTIELGDEPCFKVPGRFREAAKQMRIPDRRIWILRIGESRELPSPDNPRENAYSLH